MIFLRNESVRPHSVSQIEGSNTNMRREDSRLSLAASHLPIPNGSNRENRTGSTSTADLLRPLRFEQPGTVGREELIGRGWLFDEVSSNEKNSDEIKVIVQK